MHTQPFTNVLSLSLIFHSKDIFGESEAQTRVTCCDDDDDDDDDTFIKVSRL